MFGIDRRKRAILGPLNFFFEVFSNEGNSNVKGMLRVAIVWSKDFAKASQRHLQVNLATANINESVGGRVTWSPLLFLLKFHCADEWPHKGKR
jgi:hypothetical protein